LGGRQTCSRLEPRSFSQTCRAQSAKAMSKSSAWKPSTWYFTDCDFALSSLLSPSRSPGIELSLCLDHLAARALRTPGFALACSDGPGARVIRPQHGGRPLLVRGSYQPHGTPHMLASRSLVGEPERVDALVRNGYTRYWRTRPHRSCRCWSEPSRTSSSCYALGRAALEPVALTEGAPAVRCRAVRQEAS
jgi:hypothetical protein